MPIKIILTAVSLVFASFAIANDIDCPKGTMIKGETTPEVREAWCELLINSKRVLHGPYKAWYSNGILGNSGQYNNGNPVGIWYSWYKSGKKQGEEHFVNGKLASKIIWSENGTLIKN